MNWITYRTKELTEKYLIRFLSMERLDYFLNTGSIWFPRADTFGDKMECVKISELQKISPDFNAIEKRKQKFLISCWHLADKESLALWDTYSDTAEKRRKVALRFNRRQLHIAMNESIFRNHRFYYLTKCIHGKVQYKNLINVSFESLNKSTLKYPSFRKEKAFSYEKEYRFVIELVKPFENLGYAYNLGRPNELPFDILINPLLDKDEYLQLKNDLIGKGFKRNIKDSVLVKWLKPELW